MMQVSDYTATKSKRSRRPAKPKILEREVQAAVIAYLELARCKVIRVNCGAMYAGESAAGRKRFVRFNDTPGCADLLACVPVPQAGGDPLGVFVAIECKRPGEAATPEQQGFLADVRAAWGYAEVVTGVEDVRRVLTAMGAHAP